MAVSTLNQNAWGKKWLTTKIKELNRSCETLVVSIADWAIQKIHRGIFMIFQNHHFYEEKLN